MSECTECGARNAESATFCVRCGASLSGTVGEAEVGSDTDRIDPVGGSEVERTMVLDPEAAAGVGSEAERLLQQAAQALSEGRPEAAASRCREAIEIAPDLIAAYSLLGMAEEQRGNTIAAAGAYRRVLQLDPSRTVEREKLESLYETGSASRPEEEQEAASAIYTRYGPWVAGLGTAFIVLVILTLVGVYAWTGHRQERTFEEQMKIAREALDRGDYAAAEAAFEVALTINPDDRDARQGLRYARRKQQVSPAGERQMVSAPRSVPSYQHKIAPSSGPNPFRPIPIGGEPDQPNRQPQQQTRRAPRPPVVDTSPVRARASDFAPSPTSETESVPFGPLEEGPAAETRTTEPPSASQEDGESAEPEEPQRQGQITITFSDPEPAASEQPAAEGASDSGRSEQAAALRAQADQARASGDCARAAELYQQAANAYRADAEANPGNRAVNQAAIEACERAASLCAAEQGQ